ncbi:hypothetical protein [Aquimarina mytili]|uniref:Uncharacterized protein n=1 Tax=Aquimarina mytili TaxID=874423 RepID=A0A936ZX07_9FLAO|nr:hypothetical protein [Aquimarina mytili]MBL0683513.1 hypothetical protein [Aquimarina mytili]
MKLKLLMTFSLLWVCSASFSQEFKGYLTSVKSIDDQIQEERYSTDEVPTVDRLVFKSPIENISRKDKQFFSKKEWRKIKNQLKKNKKRISKLQDGIHTSKIIDTVYMDLPKPTRESSLSGW